MDERLRQCVPVVLAALLVAAMAHPLEARAQADGDSPSLVANPSFPGDPFDSGNTPSDTTSAVGPTRYVQFTNATFDLYDRTADAPVFLSRDNLRRFVNHPTDVGGRAFDPQVIWDDDSQRFYYTTAFTYPDERTGGLAFGFSKSASPNSRFDWCKYILDELTGVPSKADFPKMGDTADFVLIGHETLLTAREHRGWHVRWFAKPSAEPITDCPAELTTGEQLGTRRGLLTSFPDRAVPANQIDPSSTGYLVQADQSTGGSDVIQVVKVTKGSNRAPDFEDPVALKVPFYAPAENVPQPGTPYRLHADLSHFTQAVAAFDPTVGRTGIWTQHTVRGGAGAEVRWYEIDGATASLLQSGVVSDPHLSYFNAAISSDRAQGAPMTGGSMVLGFNSGSATSLSAIWMVGKVGRRDQTTPTLVHNSTAPAVEGNRGCRPATLICSWGDYSGATPDPAVASGAGTGRVWLTNQWQSTSGAVNREPGWQTWNWAASFVGD